MSGNGNDLSRRGFFKLSGALAATTAVAGIAATAPAQAAMVALRQTRRRAQRQAAESFTRRKPVLPQNACCVGSPSRSATLSIREVSLTT